jgi:DNA-binding SARP family transcriptional activator
MLRINVLGELTVTGGDQTATWTSAQPRRLALLALLAVEGRRGMTWDDLQACLWPDVEAERGRGALTQALRALRRDLGSDEALLGLDDLRLNPDLVETDIGEFHDALAAGALEQAAECYRGPFLEGFHLAGADAFQRWVDDHRQRLADAHRDLLDRLALRCRAQGDLKGESTWLRKLAAIDPVSGPTTVRLMTSLAEAGEAAAALQHARIYEALVRQELDVPADPAVLELSERLRRDGRLPDRSEAAKGEVVATPPQGSPADKPAPMPEPAAEISISPAGVQSFPVPPLPGPVPGRASGWAAVRLAPRASLESPQPMRRLSGARRWAIVAMVLAALALIAYLVLRSWLSR